MVQTTTEEVKEIAKALKDFIGKLIERKNEFTRCIIVNKDEHN